MSKLYVPIIETSIEHTSATKKLANNRSASIFVRWSILDFATERGFSDRLPNSKINGASKPEYLAPDIWEKVKDAHIRSKNIDYSYVLAFFWLLSLPEFKRFKKAALVREIVNLSLG